MKATTTLLALAAIAGAAPQGASAQCTPETMYVPVTETVTVGCSSSASPASSTPMSDGGLPIHTTIYSTSTATSTVTAMPGTTSMTPVSSAGGSSYYYGVNSGTTSWLNGISPSSGASLTTATGATTIYVSPAATMPSSSSTACVDVQLELELARHHCQ
ncbi:hypothetical protein EJ03DRAFT_27848 [Teratosphaeria nubilosa]|uniref:Ig-like domain-containing protein n=1 Tax=Teratosphaeria nubilosa TaxID=161662 RepID=A0A6G1KW20_9PEZI|nr:hypothetical protein EJ03DRAFT_27848 [Teratosphaeria nubilosa]